MLKRTWDKKSFCVFPVVVVVVLKCKFHGLSFSEAYQISLPLPTVYILVSRTDHPRFPRSIFWSIF